MGECIGCKMRWSCPNNGTVSSLGENYKQGSSATGKYISMENQPVNFCPFFSGGDSMVKVADILTDNRRSVELMLDPQNKFFDILGRMEEPERVTLDDKV